MTFVISIMIVPCLFKNTKGMMFADDTVLYQSSENSHIGFV